MRSKLLSFLNWITCILHNKCISICWAVSTNLDYLSLLLFLFWHVDSFAKNKRRRCQQHLNLQTSRIWANRPYTRGSRLLFEVIKSIIILIILVQHEQKFPFQGWKVLNSCALSGPHSYLHFGCRIKRIKQHDWMLKLKHLPALPQSWTSAGQWSHLWRIHITFGLILFAFITWKRSLEPLPDGVSS